MEALEIDGAWVLTPKIHKDARGSFFEWFREQDLLNSLGYSMDITQANCSVSHRGVIRGVHFADVPPGQAKFVTCLTGQILDVVVDLRTGSPTYSQWVAVRLDGEERRSVYISEGLGHAFMVLSAEATVMYMCSTSYAPKREHSVNPLDPDVGIDWPAGLEPVLSDRDANAPTLAQALSEKMLPEYSTCLDHAATLLRARQRAGPQPDCQPRAT